MKSNLRKAMIQKRNLLSHEEVVDKSRSICESVIRSEWYKHADTVMLYMDYKNEVRTEYLIEHALVHRKRVVLPVVDFTTHTLTLVEIHSLTSDMRLSSYGILEPIVTEESIRSIDDIDLILSPGVAFDLKGYRLGYGGGFYDKLLETADRSKLKVLALAFDMQIIDQVPVESYDKPIDAIATESNLTFF